MNEELLTVEVEEGRDDLGGIQTHSLHGQVGKPKSI